MGRSHQLIGPAADERIGYSSSLPEDRTKLYTSYMETLLDREASKNTAVKQHRPDLEEITSYLGWHLQSRAETAEDKRRLPIERLRQTIRKYLIAVEKNPDIVEELFRGVTDRLWALSSQVQGTFEFDVQPLREYFAARFLDEFAGADQKDFDKSSILRLLVRSAYWLNTARFFAGFASPNELAGLVEALELERDDLAHPRQVLLATWTLLADGVFQARTPTKRSAAALLADDLSVRMLAHLLATDPETPVPFLEQGAQQVVDLLQQQLRTEPEHALAAERVVLLVALLPDRSAFDIWWKPALKAFTGRRRVAWLSIGSIVQAASRLQPGEVAALDLPEEGAPVAVGAGDVPAEGSDLEHSMVQAVLAGHCSDMQAASPSVAADLVKLLAPQHLLRRAARGDLSYVMVVGHLDEPVSANARQVAFNRLKRRDLRFGKVQLALRVGKGQAGTTSPWGHTARAISAIYGPCWLAAEIAVIGAALSPEPFKTSGDVTPGSLPLGPAPDYGRLIEDVRLNRSRSAWWIQQYDDHPDLLSRATWALALLAVAAPDVVDSCLRRLDSTVGEMPQPMLDALMAASSRIGASGLARRLPVAASAGSAESALLIAHHAAPLDGTGGQSPLTDEQLGDLSRFGASAWPALHALTARRFRPQSSAPFEQIHRFGPSAIQPPESVEIGSQQRGDLILRNAGEYPLAWVLAAEIAVSANTRDEPLASVADESDWFPR